MADDFYPFVDSGDPAPDNSHLTGTTTSAKNPVENGGAVTAATEAAALTGEEATESAAAFATRIAVYDDMFSTPRVIVISPGPVRSYLEEITNTVYRAMKEQGGRISLMVIREIVENFIHAHFVEPIISILDEGNTIRFADQGPGIEDKERAFEFGVTSADRDQKRYIRGTGAGFPMVQQYLENAGGAVSIEDNLGQGTVVTVTLDPARTEEVQAVAARGGAVRGAHVETQQQSMGAGWPQRQQAAGSMLADQYGQMGQYMQAGQAYPQPQTYPQAQQWQQPQQQGMPPQPIPQQGWGAGYQMGAGAQTQVAGYPQMQPQQMWGGYAQPYTVPSQQNTWQAPGQIPSQMPGQMPPQAAPAGGVYVSERGMMALSYLASQNSCGPTDLVRTYGSSVSTWSRELETLQHNGFVIKQGQKRILTEVGRSWINNQMNGGE